LDMNEPWQQLVRSGRASVVVKGHTHHREVFYKAGIVVVDGGTLLRYGPPGGVVVDLVQQTYNMVDAAGATPTMALRRPGPLPAQRSRPVPSECDCARK
jgi:hypothetical protein